MKSLLLKDKGKCSLNSMLYYGAASVLPALVLLLAYIGLEVYPFGELSVLVGDMNSQYVDFFSSLRDLLTGDAHGNVFYNWTSGGGINYIALMAYYLVSPFNIVLLLFPKSQITTAIMVMILLKIAATGCAFAYYAKKTFGLNYALSLILSWVYALSGFAVIYTCNLMWLDTVILLPLYIMGLDAMVNKGKITMYVVTLFGLFVTNYYLSYMAGIFGAIYFFSVALPKFGLKKEMWKKTALFSVSSALTIGAAVILLLPSFFSLMDSYVGGISTGVVNFTDDFYGVVSKLFVGSYDDITYGLPNIYFGLFPLMMAILYFFNSKIKLKEKISSALVLGVFFASFLIPKLNLIWHMFRAPTWFPVRYSYLFIFFCLMLCGRCLAKPKGIKPANILLSGAISLLLLFLGTLHIEEGGNDNLMKNEIILNVVFCVAYILAMLAVVKVRKKALVSGLSLVLAVVVAGEVYFATDSTISSLNEQLRYKEKSTYTDFYNQYSACVNYIESIDNSYFYRTEHDKIRDANDNLSLGINGISHYSSVSNQGTNILYNRLGLHRGFANKYFRYTGAPNYFDSLMGVKYVMSKGGREDFGYEKIQKIGDVGIYKNNYALPLVYGASSAAPMEAPDVNQSTFAVVNDYLSALSGVNEDCYTLQKGYKVSGDNVKKSGSGYSVQNSVAFSIEAKRNGYYYFKSDNNFKEYPDVFVNQKLVSGWRDLNYDIVLSLGYFEKGKTIKVEYRKLGSNRKVTRAEFAVLNEDVYKNVFTKLSNSGITLDDTPSSTLSGKLTLEEDGYIVTSIPYDVGWTVKVDGKKQEVLKLGNGLLAVKATKGEHQVKFTFVPHGFVSGLIISIISIGLIVLFILVLRKREKTSPEPKKIEGTQKVEVKKTAGRPQNAQNPQNNQIGRFRKTE